MNRENQTTRDARNINPTAPALVAMNIWGDRYGKQKGGSMDFWDSLSQSEKQHCTQVAEYIRKAPMHDAVHIR